MKFYKLIKEASFKCSLNALFNFAGTWRLFYAWVGSIQDISSLVSVFLFLPWVTEFLHVHVFPIFYMCCGCSDLHGIWFKTCLPCAMVKKKKVPLYVLVLSLNLCQFYSLIQPFLHMTNCCLWRVSLTYSIPSILHCVKKLYSCQVTLQVSLQIIGVFFI